MTRGAREADKRRTSDLVLMLCAATLWHGYGTAQRTWAGRSKRQWLLLSTRRTVGLIYTLCCGWQVVYAMVTSLGWAGFGIEIMGATDWSGRELLVMCVRTPLSTWSKTLHAET